MNINKSILVILILHSFLSFSQKKSDVYFVIKDNNPEYIVLGVFDNNLDYIYLVDKKEYEYHQNKVKEAKNKGEYYFDPESGRDNLNIKVSKLTFEIISREKTLMPKHEIKKLNLVDYNWIINNSWKRIAKQPYDFKDIYFLHKIEKDSFELYKVGVTIVAH